MMMVMRVGPKNAKAAVQAAVSVLRRGGVIAYPTETTYGLGCDPRNAKAVARIYHIKGREKNKPFLLVAADVKQAKRVADFGTPGQASVLRITRKYWPGPLTLVLPARCGLAKAIAPRGEVAIRVSSAEFVRAVCRAYGFPIVSTSANRSGEPDARSGLAILKMFSSASLQPDLLLDSGSLPRRKPSTVARISHDGSIEILRRGAVRLGLLRPSGQPKI
jgi:L-threonylcarbamoyladenylate synthase